MKEIKLSDISKLKYKIYRIEASKPKDPDIFIIKFIGNYGMGSKGNSDASFMDAIINLIKHNFYSRTILDLSQLHYEWGDEISRILDGFVLEENTGDALVLGENGRKGISSLYQMDYNKNIDENNNIFSDIESALHYMKTELSSMEN